MIYTLTLNPAIDKTVVIPNFTPGSVNRIQSLRTDVGGKGINVSKCLKALQCESTAVAFWGGNSGIAGPKYLQENGIDQLSIRIQEDTRTNLKIIDQVLQLNTDINEPGPVIDRSDLNRLIELLDDNIQPGDILILSGSIPHGIDATIYRDFIYRYKSQDVYVYLDADGENFRHAVTACPHLIKPNIDELSSFMNTTFSCHEEIVRAAQHFLRDGINEVVVSLGSEGALLVTKDHCYFARGLQVPVQSTVGAGDSMVAAFAFGQQVGMDDKQRLRLSVAISAASVMCSGTQAPDAKTIKKLYTQVKTEELFYDC